MIVLDASVLLKWFLEEEDRPIALKLHARHVEGVDLIAVPELAFYEVGNALVIRTSLSLVEIEDYLHQLQGCELEVMEFSKLSGWVSIARRYGLTAYDASYVTLAQRLHCRMVTSDERLLNRLKGVSGVVHLREAVKR